MERAPRTRLYADAVGVFQGGGCRAAAYAGAFAAAQRYGVHFSALAGTSAGAIAAVLIAAGATPSWMTEQLGSLDFKSLLSPPNKNGRSRRASVPLPPGWRKWADLVQYNGMHSSKKIEEWLEDRLRDLIKEPSGPRVLFRDLRLPVTVVAADTLTGRARVFGTTETPEEIVSRAVRASCSIPFFFQPMGSLVDGGLLSNLPSYLMDKDSSHRHPVLAFNLVEEPETTESPENVLRLVGALANTVVHGGQAIQSHLQPHITEIHINTGKIRATDFDLVDKQALRQLQQAGFDAVELFFRNEAVKSRPDEPPTRTLHSAETFDIVASEILAAQESVWVCMPDTRWVFDLYSSLLLARMRGCEVTVLLPEYKGELEAIVYQRQLLRALGCRLQEVPAATPLPVHAFVMDHRRDRRGAVVYSTQGIVHASVLRGRAGDEPVIALLAEAIERLLSGSASVGDQPSTIVGAGESDLVRILHQVDQYRTANIVLEAVPLRQVDSWARYAHAYKQRQQEEMAVLLRDAGLEAFEPYYVEYANGQHSMALPPIVEQSGDSRFTVVNGLSRMLLLSREGREEALCAVVRDVSARPPASTPTPLSEVSVKVGRRGDPRDRYADFAQGHVRHVEAAAHTLALLAPTNMEGEPDGDPDPKRS